MGFVGRATVFVTDVEATVVVVMGFLILLNKGREGLAKDVDATAPPRDTETAGALVRRGVSNQINKTFRYYLK